MLIKESDNERAAMESETATLRMHDPTLYGRYPLTQTIHPIKTLSSSRRVIAESAGAGAA